jgi:hypothetical protein
LITHVIAGSDPQSLALVDPAPSIPDQVRDDRPAAALSSGSFLVPTLRARGIVVQVELPRFRLAFAIAQAFRPGLRQFEFELLAVAPAKIFLRRLMHGSSLNVLID